MPVYEYTCPECGDAFEQRTTVDGRDLVYCKCGHLALRALTSVARVWAPTRMGQ